MPDKFMPDPDDAAKAAHERDMREMFAQELLGLGTDLTEPQDPQDVISGVERAEEVAEAGRTMSRAEQTLQAPDAPSLDPNASELSFSSWDEGGGSFRYSSGVSEHEKKLFIASLTRMAYVDNAYVSQETVSLRDTYAEMVALLTRIAPTDQDPTTYSGTISAVTLTNPDTGGSYEVRLSYERNGSNIAGITIRDQASYEQGHADMPRSVDRPWSIEFSPHDFTASLVVENFATPLNSNRNPKNWTDRYIRQYIETHILSLLQQRAANDTSKLSHEDIEQAKERAESILSRSINDVGEGMEYLTKPPEEMTGEERLRYNAIKDSVAEWVFLHGANRMGNFHRTEAQAAAHLTEADRQEIQKRIRLQKRESEDATSAEAKHSPEKEALIQEAADRIAAEVRQRRLGEADIVSFEWDDRYADFTYADWREVFHRWDKAIELGEAQ